MKKTVQEYFRKNTIEIGTQKINKTMVTLVFLMVLSSIILGFLLAISPLVSAAGDVNPGNSQVTAINSPQPINHPITIIITLKNATGENITDEDETNFTFTYSLNATGNLTENDFHYYGGGTYYWNITDDVAEGPVTVNVTVRNVTITQTVNLTWYLPPEVTIVIPLNNGFYRTLTQINGTVIDHGVGINRVNITIYNTPSQLYWNGTAWEVGVHWLPTSLTIGTTNNWTYDSTPVTWYNGTYYIVNATAVDYNSNESVVVSHTFGCDTYPPQSLTNISVGGITTNSATITWMTDENTTSVVEYGTTISYGKLSTNSTYTLIHSCRLTGLSSGITYHYRVISSDFAGNPISSSDLTFLTKSEGPGGGGSTSSGSQQPVAHAGGPYYGYINQSITFNGSQSTEPNGTIAGYRWDWTNDGTYDTNWSISPMSTHTYTDAGTYIVQLEVKDSAGYRDTDTAYVNITSIQPLPPIADVKGPYSGLTYQNIYFDGSQSIGTDGIIVNYTWDFGDETFGYTMSPLHSYQSNGTFTVTLTVTDNNNLQDSDTTTAVILPDENRDNVSDIIEQTIGATITPSDIRLIQMNGTEYDLIDTNGDGNYDVLYNPTENTKTMLGQQDGKQLLDIDGDGIWDYIYDPVYNSLTPYRAASPIIGFPVMMIAIVAVIVSIGILVVWMYRTGRI